MRGLGGRCRADSGQRLAQFLFLLVTERRADHLAADASQVFQNLVRRDFPDENEERSAAEISTL